MAIRRARWSASRRRLCYPKNAARHLAQGFLFLPPVIEQRFLRLAARQSPMG